jgi:hypothetical protein
MVDFGIVTIPTEYSLLSIRRNAHDRRICSTRDALGAKITISYYILT